MQAVCVVSARGLGLGLNMEVKKPMTAEEQRREQLLGYLAAKGKLKPQNNPKYYLRDTTNIQKKPLSQPSKSLPISKPKPNTLPKNPKLVFHGQKAETGNHLSRQQSRAAPSKAPSQNDLQVSKPSIESSSLDGPVHSVNIQNGHGLHQQKTEEQWETQTKAASCSLAQNCVNGLEGGKGTNQRLLEDDACSVNFDTVHKETGSSLICVGDQTCAFKVKQTTVHGQKKVATSSANHRKQQTSTTGRRTSTLGNHSKPPSNSIQATYHFKKPVSPASKTQNSVNKLPVMASGMSKASQPAPQSMANRRQSCKVVSSRIDSWRPKSTQNLGKGTVGVHSMKPNAGNPNKGLKTAAIMEPRKPKSPTVIKDAPRQRTVSGTSKMTQNKDTCNGPNKTTTFQMGKSVCSTVNPRAQKTSGASCNKPWLIPRGGTVSLNNKHAQGSKTESAGNNMKGLVSAAQTKPSNVKENVTSKLHVTPKTAEEDRRRKLEEWLITKGKTYKRPPIHITSKKSLKSKKHDLHNCSLWAGIEEEEEMLLLSDRINSTLSECLNLIHQPINELRDTIFDIMKSINKKPKVVRFEPLPGKEPTLECEELEDDPTECPNGKIKRVSTPFKARTSTERGSAVKFQVACVASKKKEPGSQEWKFLTPVRRSLRINQAVSRYPETLKEHDTVVASLTELLDTADAEAYLYTRNDALPDEGDLHLLGAMNQDQSEQREGPV
uniref:Cytoskeleton associated protein 2 like n=1 Tax=Leptobrachium leishanense TaxID=445787 RepID=A0A8C5M438_9ANUR